MTDNAAYGFHIYAHRSQEESLCSLELSLLSIVVVTAEGLYNLAHTRQDIYLVWVFSS